MEELESFLAMLEESADAGDEDDAKGALRTQLAKGRRRYVDVSGDGTRWRTSGTWHGVAFATGEVELGADALVSVSVDAGQAFRDRSLAGRAAKVFSNFNARLKIPGMFVDGERVVFRCEPFDPISSPYTADEVMALAFSTVHDYAFVWAALKAGVDPWDILGLEPKRPAEPDGGFVKERGELRDQIERLMRALDSEALEACE